MNTAGPIPEDNNEKDLIPGARLGFKCLSCGYNFMIPEYHRKLGALPTPSCPKCELMSFSAISEFLEDIYELDNESTIQKAFDRIFEFTDELLYNDRIDDCDNVFSLIDVERISASLVIALLRSTYSARDVLLSRSSFITRTEEKLIRAKGTEVTEKLLAQLR